ncbi:hypothetical protein H4K35_06350 [Myroides sp. NP-2]|uniref:DUF5675 family protein n=1 Tax=Myroides sp. NP-2 TaxID=2759945 RepID=UPI0015FC366D|nr:DUF5675 family protein [Myroides sp. NP-2]MBB1149755.1 hypothetical protein [Myroides sp. NP-2]
MRTLVLHRLYLPEATHGLLQFDGQDICLTLELPWVANQAYISCIPEGTYPVFHRHNERFKSHLEVKKVPDRTLILFHPANNAKYDLKGCIAPVSQLLTPIWGSRSRLAMRKLLDTVEEALIDEGIQLQIQEAQALTIVQQIKTGKL